MRKKKAEKKRKGTEEERFNESSLNTEQIIIQTNI